MSIKKLSYDGKGINDASDAYCPRIATFSSGLTADEFGPLFEAAPELLALAKLIIKEWEADTTDVARGALIARLSQYAKEARDVIKKAEGK